MSSFERVATPPSHLSSNPSCTSDTRKQSISLLQKCQNPNQIAAIHANLVKNGQVRDYFVVFELLRVCFRWKAADYALKVFEQVQEPNVYLYTALIDGLSLSMLASRGISFYGRMIGSSVYPDEYVVVSVLKSCTVELDLIMGKGIHAQAMKLGLCSHRQVWLKLIELYGKCGEFGDMKKVFDEMPESDTVAMTVMMLAYFDHHMIHNACDVFHMAKDKDTVCWTAMIDGLVRNREMGKALAMFRQMQRDGVRANEVTIVCVLSACAQLGALELGKWVHHSCVKKYNIKVNHFVGSALVNFYSRCGSIEQAESMFASLQEKEVSAYNSMIVGYALNGESIKAVRTFELMIKEGIQPTYITFVGVLNACSHGGLVDFGLEIFHRMQEDYHLKPQVEHYECIVDLLGRAGQIEEAYHFIQKMDIPPDHIIWGSLLRACMVHRDYGFGEKAADILVSNDCSDTGSYILASNFYSSVGKWGAALLARAKLKEKGVRKEPGGSFIEVDNEIHEFLLGDIRHPQKKAIYESLEDLDRMMRLEGYCLHGEVVPPGINDQEWNGIY